MIDEKDYLADPCGSASLPLWKTLQIEVPDNIMVIRDDEYVEGTINGSDEPYFKMVNHLTILKDALLPKGFNLVNKDVEDFVNHINECYGNSISLDE